MLSDNIDKVDEPCNSGRQRPTSNVLPNSNPGDFRKVWYASYVAEAAKATQKYENDTHSDGSWFISKILGFFRRVWYALYAGKAAYKATFYAAYHDWSRLQDIVLESKSNDPSKQHDDCKVNPSRPFVVPKDQRADVDLDKAVTAHVVPHFKVKGKTARRGSKKNQSNKKNKKR